MDKFKVGDKIKYKGSNQIVTDICLCGCNDTEWGITCLSSSGWVLSKRVEKVLGQLEFDFMRINYE